jgi:hypothetical protein
MDSGSLGYSSETEILSTGLIGDIGLAEKAPLFIVGSFEWVRKPLQKEAVDVDLGFSLAVVCELELGLGSAVHGPSDRGFSA